MSDDKHGKQQAILSELESIIDLLDDQPLGDIPVLSPIDSVDDKDQLDIPTLTPLSESDILDPPLSTPSSAPDVLPGQRGLFDESVPTDSNTDIDASINRKSSEEEASPQASSTATKARGENPFLPKHIRERLHTNKALVDIINEQTSTIKTDLTTTNQSANTDQLGLIDDLVAEYLPIIETELRRRLKQHIDTTETAAEANKDN